MMRQTTTRLRKTFQYSDDGDPNTSDDDLPEAMDEEEQIKLLHTFRAQNAARNRQYTIAILALPALSSLLYLRPLLHPSTSLLSLLSISNLGASAWMMAYLSEDPSHLIFGLQLASLLGLGKQHKTQSSHTTPQQQPPLPVLGAKIDTPPQPLALYLPPLNLVLAVLLAVAGFVGPVRAGAEGPWFALVPGLVLGVVGVARGIMAGVEGGVRELEGLRYGYLGA